MNKKPTEAQLLKAAEKALDGPFSLANPPKYLYHQKYGWLIYDGEVTEAFGEYIKEMYKG